MNTRINTLALAAIMGGAVLLARPTPASATYTNPLMGGDLALTYCCVTGQTRCCYQNSGCATKEGVCIRIVPAGE